MHIFRKQHHILGAGKPSCIPKYIVFTFINNKSGPAQDLTHKRALKKKAAGDILEVLLTFILLLKPW